MAFIIRSCGKKNIAIPADIDILSIPIPIPSPSPPLSGCSFEDHLHDTYSYQQQPDHQETTKPPFLQRVCTTNRRPFHRHNHCPFAPEVPVDESDCLMAATRRGLSPGGGDSIEWERGRGLSPQPRWLGEFAHTKLCRNISSPSKLTSPIPSGIYVDNTNAVSRNCTESLISVSLRNADIMEAGPTLLHRVKHERSVLSLAVSSKYVFAGSQTGEILVCLSRCAAMRRRTGGLGL
jgi:hypothetical protein